MDTIYLRQLETFIQVAECASFSRAAELLYLTQPAVSLQVKSLEENLGVSLFVRQEHGVSLTDAGKQFLPYARDIVNAYHEALQAMARVQDLEEGEIRLAASTIPGEFFLPRAIGQFKQKYPGIRVKLEISDTRKALESLVSGLVELAVVGYREEQALVDFIPLAADELILIAPASSPLAVGNDVDWQDLVQEEFILREPGSGTRQAAEEVLAARGRTVKDLKLGLELGSTQAIITAVAAELGLGIVSRWAAAPYIALGQIKEIRSAGFPVSRTLHLATRRAGRLSPVARVLAEFLQHISP